MKSTRIGLHGTSSRIPSIVYSIILSIATVLLTPGSLKLWDLIQMSRLRRLSRIRIKLNLKRELTKRDEPKLAVYMLEIHLSIGYIVN